MERLCNMNEESWPHKQLTVFKMRQQHCFHINGHNIVMKLIYFYVMFCLAQSVKGTA